MNARETSESTWVHVVCNSTTHANATRAALGEKSRSRGAAAHTRRRQVRNVRSKQSRSAPVDDTTGRVEADRRKNSLLFIATGFGFSLVAFVLNGLFGGISSRLAQSFALAISLGHAFVVLGCIQLAVSKGKPWYFGLLGLFSCLGVGILWFVVKDESTATR